LTFCAISLGSGAYYDLVIFKDGLDFSQAAMVTVKLAVYAL